MSIACGGHSDRCRAQGALLAKGKTAVSPRRAAGGGFLMVGGVRFDLVSAWRCFGAALRCAFLLSLCSGGAVRPGTDLAAGSWLASRSPPTASCTTMTSTSGKLDVDRYGVPQYSGDSDLFEEHCERAWDLWHGGEGQTGLQLASAVHLRAGLSGAPYDAVRKLGHANSRQRMRKGTQLKMVCCWTL